MSMKFCRYSATCPEEGVPPRSRRELNAIAALGAILNKPQWWIKWSNVEIRERWLHEIDEALVTVNVDQVTKAWPQIGQWQWPKVFGPYLEVAAYTGEDKPAKIEKVLEHVLFPPGQFKYDAFGEGEYYESDADERFEVEEHSAPGAGRGEVTSTTTINYRVVEYDLTAVDTDFDTVYRSHKVKNPFANLAWYISITAMRDRLRSWTVEQWTDDNLRGEFQATSALDANDAMVPRTRALLLHAIRDSSCSIEFVQSVFPHEKRDNVLKILHLHLRKTRWFLQQTRRDITRVVELILSKLGLSAGGIPVVSGCGHPGPVPQTWLSDHLIDDALKIKLLKELHVLEQVPDEKKDWHPNSNDQVLNLVHPSLYCGVNGVTKHLESTDLLDRLPTTASAAEHMRAIMFQPPTATFTSKSTEFQWLPCEIDVGDDGRARVRTYINNLHPEAHASLYDTIGDVFGSFVPLFDRVLSTLDTESSDGTTFYCDRGDQAAKQRLAEALKEVHADATSSLRRLVSPGLFQADTPRYSLRGSRCQVIVKIAQIVLTPEKPEYGGGSWHIEGTASERIIATGLYYYECENITESRLSFRTFVNEPDYHQSDEVGIGLAYGLESEELLVQKLGSVTAMQDRCVVFPNLYQHKVEPFRLADPTKPGVRKILAFFLVDPSNGPIPSTAVVPPQQGHWFESAVHPEIRLLGLPEVVSQQLLDLSKVGLSIEQAKEYRLKLMEERSAENFEDDEENLFSLCEH